MIDQRDKDLGYQLNRVARLLRGRMAGEAARIGITTQQAAVVLNLESGSKITPSELSDRVGMDRPTMTGIIDRLARAGRLEIADNPDDGRSRLVSLTKDGEKLVPLLARASAGVSRQALSGLSKQENEALFDLLSRVAANLEGTCNE